jgi:hypothetical protein
MVIVDRSLALMYALFRLTQSGPDRKANYG